MAQLKKTPAEVIEAAIGYGIQMHNLRWHLDNTLGNVILGTYHRLSKLDENQKWTTVVARNPCPWGEMLAREWPEDNNPWDRLSEKLRKDNQ